MILQRIKRALPGRVRDSVRCAHRRLVLWQSLTTISKHEPHELPSRKTLAALSYGWSNEGWSADPEYVEEMLRIAARVEGPILECGSGLTTILLGLLARQRNVTVWSLEHLPDWHERTRRVLTRWHFTNIELCLAPLRDFGQYAWYDAPRERMPNDFRFVVCDGPPAASIRKGPGARYGLLPALGTRLAPGCVVLLDDTAREEEARVLERWRQEHGAVVTAGGGNRRFSVITTSPISRATRD